MAGLVRLLTFTAAADILRWQTGAISGMQGEAPETAGTRPGRPWRLACRTIIVLLVPFQLVTGCLYYLFYNRNRWPRAGSSRSLS